MAVLSAGIASGAHLLVLTGLVELFEAHYLVANALASVVGGLVNFTWNKKVSFKADGSAKGQLGRYGLVSLVNLGWVTLGMYAATDGLGLPYLVGWAGTSLLTMIGFGYPTNRAYVFGTDGYGEGAALSARSQRVTLALATLFGAGRFRHPGTLATLLTMPLLIWTSQSLPVPLQAVLAGAALGTAVIVTELAGRVLGDPGDRRIVADEVAGLLVAGIGLPWGWPWWVAVFLAFRFADGVKPWPAGVIDRRYLNGWGLVLDDVVAGAYVLAGVQAAWFLAG